jgi:very-short-patch-repair endonuclease
VTVLNESVAGVAGIAAQQHGIITRDQLRSAGVSRRVVERWVRQGWLTRLHRGVYQVGAVPSAHSGELAAVLACGAAAVLSHWSAGRLWGFAPWCLEVRPVSDAAAAGVAPSPDVLLVGRTGIRRPGIRVRWTVALHPGDTTFCHGIPVTTPCRTVFDLAPEFARAGRLRELEQLAAQVIDSGLATTVEFRSLLERYPGSRSTALLRPMLDDQAGPAVTDSKGEELLLRGLRRTRLPRPRSGYTVMGFRVDFAWPAHRLIVEVDGRAHHSSRRRFDADRSRDRALAAAGWTVIRLTWRDVAESVEAAVADIAFILGRLSARQE